MLKLRFRSLASADLADVLEHYARISPSLAAAFVAELDAALLLILARPEIGSQRFGSLYPNLSLRVWSLKRFPFRIFYAADSNTLRILRIVHSRLNITANTLRYRGKPRY